MIALANEADSVGVDPTSSTGTSDSTTPPPEPDSTEKDKIKILFMAANPSDAGRLGTDKEHQTLKAQLERGSDRDRFEFLPPVFALTIEELLRATNDKPEIIHFSGHGSLKGIHITNEQNQSMPFPTNALKQRFKKLKDITKIVVLNACYSSDQAKALSEFGMYVVGIDYKIPNSNAISFSKGFYNGLGEGKSIEESIDDGRFMVEFESPNKQPIIEGWKDGLKITL